MHSKTQSGLIDNLVWYMWEKFSINVIIQCLLLTLKKEQ